MAYRIQRRRLILYNKLARELVSKVRAINPTARVVKNWEQDPDMVVRLIESWHKNIGEDFIAAPWEHISPENFR